MEWLPGLEGHDCSVGKPGGFIQRLHDLADEFKLGSSTVAIVDAARAKDIPVIQLTPRDGLFQFGYGVA